MNSYHEPPIIKTARLVLRPLKHSDAPAMFRMLSDPDNLRHSTYVPPKVLADTEKWVASFLQNPVTFYFGVCFPPPPPPPPLPTTSTTESSLSLSSSLPLIGLCGGTRTPEFGYIIDHPYTGHGFATEALIAVADAYWRWTDPGDDGGKPGLPLDEADRHRLILFTDVGNEASKRVAQKAGFEWLRHEQEISEEGDGHVAELDVWQVRRPGFQSE